MLISRALGLSIFRPQTAGGPVVSAESLLAEARIFADYSQTNTDGTVVLNQNYATPEPTSNMIPFPIGPITDEVPNANIVLTNFSTGTATKIVTTGTNRTWYMARLSTIIPKIPNGTISVRWKMRSVAGKGSQTYDTLFPGSNTLGRTVTESWTTYEQELTYAGASDLLFRFPADDTQVEVDELQFHEGTLATMPDFVDEVHGGIRKAVGHSAAMVQDVNGAVDTTGQSAGVILIDPDFPSNHAYFEFTHLDVRSAPFAGSGYLVNRLPIEGGSSTETWGVLDSTPYTGEVANLFGGTSRSQVGASIGGKGVFMHGVRRNATHRTHIINGIPAYTNEVAWSGMSTSRFFLDGFTNTNTTHQSANTALGKHVFSVIWDRALSDTELKIVSDYLLTEAENAGHSMAPIYEWHVVSGDSNSTRGTGDWTQVISADGYFSPGDNMLLSVTSVGGQGLDQLERDANGTESGLPDETITTNGRFGAIDLPILDAAGYRASARALYHICVGTNDWDLLNNYSGTAEDQANAYVARVQTFIAHVLANVPDSVDIMWHSLLPQSATTRPNFEDQRNFVNPAMATWIGTQPRVFLCPVGTSSTIGDPANFATYYIGDEIHLSSAGDAEYASIAKTAIETWRAS